MKKHYTLLTIAILTILIAIPTVSRAVESTDDTAVDTSARVQTDRPANLPPVPRPGTPAMTALEKLRATKEAREQNIKNNEANRNRLLEAAKAASGTPAERRAINQDKRGDLKDTRTEKFEDMRNASSSGERREIRRDMRVDQFQIRKDALARQLGVTLNNLKQIRERISSRIDKAASEGRNMTEAKRLLVIADAKIATAGNTIAALIALNPSATSSASTTVDLIKPRQVGEVAIKALKDAHKALVDVVVAIARNMGKGNATTTPTATLPATTSATTTATTTTTSNATSTATSTNSTSTSTPSAENTMNEVL